MAQVKQKKKKDARKIVKTIAFWTYTAILWLIGLILAIVLLAIKYDYTLNGVAGQYHGIQIVANFLFVDPTHKNGIWVTIVAIIAILVISSIARVMMKAKIRLKKAATVYSLIVSLVKWGVILGAVFAILWAWGLNPGAIVASIGILALIVGIGCQSLISDIVAGIFLVADDAFEVGDIVVVDDFRGTITEIGLKTTKLEDAGGNIKVISNSKISSMVNLTNSLSIAIVEISIPYEENLRRTETLLMQHLKEMKKEVPAIVDGPYYKGVEDMADSAVILKVIAKVKEEDRFQATRDMKRSIYMFLNNNAITVPYPQLTITQGPNPADHPEWVYKEKEEQKAAKEAVKQQEESKDMEHVNDVQ